jgi:hypothetical protein
MPENLAIIPQMLKKLVTEVENPSNIGLPSLSNLYGLAHVMAG